MHWFVKLLLLLRITSDLWQQSAAHCLRHTALLYLYINDIIPRHANASRYKMRFQISLLSLNMAVRIACKTKWSCHVRPYCRSSNRKRMKDALKKILTLTIKSNNITALYKIFGLLNKLFPAHWVYLSDTRTGRRNFYIKCCWRLTPLFSGTKVVELILVIMKSPHVFGAWYIKLCTQSCVSSLWLSLVSIIYLSKWLSQVSIVLVATSWQLITMDSRQIYLYFGLPLLSERLADIESMALWARRTL